MTKREFEKMSGEFDLRFNGSVIIRMKEQTEDTVPMPVYRCHTAGGNYLGLTIAKLKGLVIWNTLLGQKTEMFVPWKNIDQV